MSSETENQKWISLDSLWAYIPSGFGFEYVAIGGFAKIALFLNDVRAICAPTPTEKIKIFKCIFTIYVLILL